jgi:hypothetical protein
MRHPLHRQVAASPGRHVLPVPFHHTPLSLAATPDAVSCRTAQHPSLGFLREKPLS